MIKNTLKKIILAASIFCMPFAAGAWGLQGHRIVGQIADSYLTKKAKKEISRRGNPGNRQPDTALVSRDLGRCAVSRPMQIKGIYLHQVRPRKQHQ